jgi:cytochrome b involved in lipid metabolism
VSYGVGVYDITEMIKNHKNPEKTIMLAAGLALDHFWEEDEFKKIHDKPEIYEMLEKCRIGNLKH